jgi:hypothetical protein
VAKDTLAFGVYLPNTLDANGKGQDPNNDWTQNFTINGTTFGLFNVEQLESITDYNFFSNIPTEIQEAIENRNVADIRTKLSVIAPAPLMAATEEELSPFTVRSFFDTAVGHSGMPDNVESATKTRPVKIAASEVSPRQIGSFKVTDFSTNKNSFNRFDMSQISTSQISTSQSSMSQVSREQIGIPQNRLNQTRSTQISSKQIGSSQISPTQIYSFKISPSQVNTPQVSTFESSNQATDSISFSHFTNNSQQFNSSEIPFSRFVPSQQFISSDFPNHSSTSSFVSNIKDTATNIWSDILKSKTSFDLNFQIKDLPTGQLASSTITSSDNAGNPYGGKIYIDSDANNSGWFIDSTPSGNSEFTPNTDS